MSPATDNLTSHQAQTVAGDLASAVQPHVRRGRLIARYSAVIIAASFFCGLMLITALADALLPLHAGLRLVVLVLAVVATGLVVTIRLGRARRADTHARQTAQGIELAAHAKGQPVVRALSVIDNGHASDRLTDALIQRARLHAVSLAEAVRPAQVYPFNRLSRQGRWLWLAAVGVIVFAVLFPAQSPSMLKRVFMPWLPTPPFSLARLEPTWTPSPPAAGSNVQVNVTAGGVQPDRVEMIRIDPEGRELERFAMPANEKGGFSQTLLRVDQPIHFRLEANGRPTRAYTIEPEQAVADANTTQQPATDDEPQSDEQVTTSNNAEAGDVASGDPQWPDLRQQIERLLGELSMAEAMAGELDPLDPEALSAFAENVADLAARAEALSDQLAALEGQLPADAAASLAALRDALAQLKVAGLPTTPGTAPGSGEPASARQWLDQARQAAGQDQESIAKGLGQSSIATETGLASGGPGEQAPTFIDPAAQGTYDEQGTTGDAGPLPDAVMQQVPPSYRPLVAAYFDKLSEQDTPTGNAP